MGSSLLADLHTPEPSIYVFAILATCHLQTIQDWSRQVVPCGSEVTWNHWPCVLQELSLGMLKHHRLVTSVGDVMICRQFTAQWDINAKQRISLCWSLHLSVISRHLQWLHVLLCFTKVKEWAAIRHSHSHFLLFMLLLTYLYCIFVPACFIIPVVVKYGIFSVRLLLSACVDLMFCLFCFGCFFLLHDLN